MASLRLSGFLLLLFLAGCASGPPVVHMIHPTTRAVVSCDAANWNPEENGCLSWFCIKSLARKQGVRNCVASRRSLGFITAAEMEDRKERAEGEVQIGITNQTPGVRR